MKIVHNTVLKRNRFYWSYFFLNCVYLGGDQNLGVQLPLFRGGGQGGLDYAHNVTAHMKVTYV